MNHSKRYNSCPKCSKKATYDCGKYTSWSTLLRFNEPVIPSCVIHNFECECGCAWATTIYLQATKMKKEITNEQTRITKQN